MIKQFVKIMEQKNFKLHDAHFIRTILAKTKS